MYTLAPLPYEYDALEPVISKKIMQLHHDKHHKAYVDGANAALGKLMKSRSGELEIDLKATLRDLSFHTNGHLLHEIFWQNMRKPVENNQPTETVKQMLERNFTTLESFRKEFTTAAVTTEGSGWSVLAKDGSNNLFVMQVEKHNYYHIVGFKPILVLDVWEHAYYLDYLNNRAEYVNKWWQVVNWDDVEKRLQ